MTLPPWFEPRSFAVGAGLSWVMFLVMVWIILKIRDHYDKEPSCDAFTQLGQDALRSLTESRRGRPRI